MALGCDLWHVWTLAAAVACGFACAEIVGQADGEQDGEAPRLALALAVLACGVTAAVGRSSEPAGPKAPAPAAPPRGGGPEGRAEAGGAAEEAAGAGRGAAPGPPAPPRPEETAAAPWLCCCAPPRRAAAAEGPGPEPGRRAAPAPPAGSPAGPPGGAPAGGAAGELRARLADLLGPPGADGQALAAVERYGGEGSCLPRFLRARKGDVGAAERMFRSTVEFRRRTGTNHILDSLRARKVWASVRPLWTAAPVMFTAKGNLVVYFKLANFLRIWQQGIPEEDLRMFYISWMERILALQGRGRARAGRGPDSEMPGSMEVYDLSGVGLSHLRCLPAMRMMMRILGIGQDHYPEMLHTAMMINVPTVANTPMRMVHSVLDAGTRAKFRFCRDNGDSLLAEILQVNREELVKRYDLALSDELLQDLT